MITPHGYCVPDGSAGLHGYSVLCNQGVVGVLGFLVEWKGEEEAMDWRKQFHTPAHETDIRRRRAEGCRNERVYAWTLLRDSTACDDAKEQTFLLSHGIWETVTWKGSIHFKLYWQTQHVDYCRKLFHHPHLPVCKYKENQDIVCVSMSLMRKECAFCLISFSYLKSKNMF